MRKTGIIFTVGLFLIFSGSLLANPVMLYWVNVSPGLNMPVTAGGTTYGSMPTGVYNVAIDMNGDGNYQMFSAHCVDPMFASHSPNPYSIIAIPDQDNYLQAAYIFSQFGEPLGNQEAADKQAAIWSVIGGFSFPDGLSQNALNMISEAVEAVAGGWNATEGLSLAVSPAEGGFYGDGYQDFIIRTPEPAGILLLGLGLAGLWIVGRKRIQKA